MLDRYARGKPGVSAQERIALFKLAWEATGEGFGQRMLQYVRYYSGDPVRMTASFYEQADKSALFETVERALGHREGQPLPISASNPASLPPSSATGGGSPAR